VWSGCARSGRKGVGRRWFVDSGSPRQGGLLRHPAGRRGYPVRLLLVGGGEVAQWAQVGVRGLSEGVAAVDVEVRVDQR